MTSVLFHWVQFILRCPTQTCTPTSGILSSPPLPAVVQPLPSSLLPSLGHLSVIAKPASLILITPALRLRHRSQRDLKIKPNTVTFLLQILPNLCERDFGIKSRLFNLASGHAIKPLPDFLSSSYFTIQHILTSSLQACGISYISRQAVC